MSSACSDPLESTAHLDLLYDSLQKGYYISTEGNVEQTDNGLKATGANSQLTIRSFSDCSDGKDLP